jgi:hypothetical protein
MTARRHHGPELAHSNACPTCRHRRYMRRKTLWNDAKPYLFVAGLCVFLALANGIVSLVRP